MGYVKIDTSCCENEDILCWENEKGGIVIREQDCQLPTTKDELDALDALDELKEYIRDWLIKCDDRGINPFLINAVSFVYKSKIKGEIDGAAIIMTICGAEEKP